MKALEKHDAKSRLTLTELAEETGISKSSLSNYFKTLVHVGVLEKEQGGGFAVGPKAHKYMVAWLGDLA